MRRAWDWTMVNRMSMLRSYFARTSDPYAGGDLDNGQRIASVFFGLQVVLILVLFPLSPPTHAIGRAGWLVALGVVGAGVFVTLECTAGAFRAGRPCSPAPTARSRRWR